MSRTTDREPVLHPEAEEAWFRALSEEQKAELHQGSQARTRHDVDLRRRLVQRHARRAAVVATTFATFDLIGPAGGPGSLTAAVALGALLGVLLERAHAGRLLSGASALIAFLFLEWVTRGGLSGVHLFGLFPVAALCALQGLQRENGE